MPVVPLLIPFERLPLPPRAAAGDAAAEHLGDLALETLAAERVVAVGRVADGVEHVVAECLAKEFAPESILGRFYARN